MATSVPPVRTDVDMLSNGGDDAASDWNIVPYSGEGLRAEAAIEHGATTTEARGLQAVLSVVAPPVDCGARAPLRLVAVLDKSGSMQGEKLRLVRETMLFMLRHLSERDALGIVEYDTDVKVAAPLTYCNTDGRARLEAALKRLQAGSQTNLSGGVLKGLDLHRADARQASAAPASTPLQRLRIGNTYRRLSEEEAHEREHCGHPGASPPEGMQRVHEWTMQLRFDVPEDEALVEKVVYKLHASFRESVVEIMQAPFQLTRHGWGTFVVSATVHLCDGRSFELQHQLSFDDPETFQTLLLPLRSPPAGLDYLVNGVKKLRVTSLDLDRGVTSIRNPDATGRTLHMNGVSYGQWGSVRRTTVPDDQLAAADRIMALFEGKGAEDRVEFTDTDGDRIVFLAPEGAPQATACAAASKDVEQGVVRSTFLFTDGLANVGIKQPEELCAVAQAALGELGDRKCSLSTFGFGKDHNADLLQRLAEMGEGIYSYVEDKDRIGEAFGEALGGLLSTTHQNVCLSLELAPGVGFSRAFTSYPVEGPIDVDGSRVVRVELGDLFAEERRDILVEMLLPAGGEGFDAPQALGRLQARGFSVLARRTEVADPVSLAVERRADADLAAPCHPQVERHRNRHLATEALEAGRAAAEGRDLVAARRLLMAALDGLSASPLTVQGDAVCIGLLTDLKECLADLEHEQRYREYGSKKMNCMKGAHMKQRACFGQDFSEQYSNVGMKAMKASFKMNCS